MSKKYKTYHICIHTVHMVRLYSYTCEMYISKKIFVWLIQKKIYTNAKDIKERTKLLIFVIGTCGMWNQLTTKLPMGPLEDTGTFFSPIFKLPSTV